MRKVCIVEDKKIKIVTNIEYFTKRITMFFFAHYNYQGGWNSRDALPWRTQEGILNPRWNYNIFKNVFVRFEFNKTLMKIK